MKIRINEYCHLDNNGIYELTLSGNYERSYMFDEPHWYWEVDSGDISLPVKLLNKTEHLAMIEKYNQWREQRTTLQQLNEEMK